MIGWLFKILKKIDEGLKVNVKLRVVLVVKKIVGKYYFCFYVKED